MNNVLEMNFINKYIIKEKKDRLIYEFSNPKKRENALMRFSHNVESLVNNKFIKYRCDDKTLNKYINVKKDLYVISLDKLNGEVCTSEEAFSQLKNQYMPVIIIDDDFVVIKSENEDANDNIIVLK